MDEFPGNRQAPQARKPQRDAPPAAITATNKKVERVIQGEVIRRKKPFGKKLKEMFLGDEDITVGEYLREDVVLPAIKDLIYDIVVGGAQQTLFPGAARMSHRRGSRGGGRFGPATGNVNYGAFAQQPVGPAQGRQNERMSRRGRATHDFGEILIPSRTEAEAVLEGLFELVNAYQQATVSDLYELVGISSNFTDRGWGWTDLRGSRVIPAGRGFFVLDLPPTQQLD